MVLAGLVAGGLTASTAFAPEPSATVIAAPAAAPTTTVAEVVLVPVEAAEPAPVVDDADLVEWRYRRSLPVVAARSTTTPGSLVRPAQGARTGWFGERRRSHRHVGIDFDGDTGDPVVSAGSGTVTHAGQAPDGYGGYGRMVLVDHGDGVTTLYAHLSRVAVTVGTKVQAGQYLGAIGTTGAVTGSHLHFEVRVGGRPVDPADWLAS